MGSPGRNLNIPEHLRAWHEAGLHYVLKSPVADTEQAGPTAAVNAPASRSDTAAESPAGNPAHAAESARMPAPSQDSPTQSASRPAADAGAGTAKQGPAGDDPPEVSSPAQSDDYTAWAEPWRSLWLKTPHDPKIVWTYYDLGAHMGGRPDPEIGKLLQSLIYYFRWPKGTIAFWPMNELAGDDCVPNVDMFWRGVDKLATKHVAIFGPDVLPLVAPDAPAHATGVRVGEVTLYTLPTLAELQPMLPHERLIALQIVKQLSF
jgi:hypothetical protein